MAGANGAAYSDAGLLPVQPWPWPAEAGGGITQRGRSYTETLVDVQRIRRSYSWNGFLTQVGIAASTPANYETNSILADFALAPGTITPVSFTLGVMESITTYSLVITDTSSPWWSPGDVVRTLTLNQLSLDGGYRFNFGGNVVNVVSETSRGDADPPRASDWHLAKLLEGLDPDGSFDDRTLVFSSPLSESRVGSTPWRRLDRGTHFGFDVQAFDIEVGGSGTVDDLLIDPSHDLRLHASSLDQTLLRGNQVLPMDDFLRADLEAALSRFVLDLGPVPTLLELPEGDLSALIPQGEFRLRLWDAASPVDSYFGVPGESVELTGTLSTSPLALSVDGELGDIRGAAEAASQQFILPGDLCVLAPHYCDALGSVPEEFNRQLVPVPAALSLMLPTLLALARTARQRHSPS
jgi:hypothetical protein